MLLSLAYCFSCYMGKLRQKIIANKNKGKVYLNEFSLFRYGMVWYGMVWYGMVWYGMVWS